MQRVRDGPPRYADRADAGRRLAGELARYAGPGTVVLGLPRGGVPVAAAVAGELGAELDVFVVRKLGVPWQPELAMGAVASGGVRVLNDDVVRRLGIDPHDVDEVTRAETAELTERERRYRHDRAPVPIAGRTAILVDDGLATGATARAAVAAVRRLDPLRVVLAVPVGPREALTDLAAVTDEVVCPWVPRAFQAVGQWYDDFRPTTDEDVASLLRQPA